MASWPARSGIKAGMTVLLMADVTRMAWRSRKVGDRFSLEEFLNAFLEFLGPKGTLLVPTYNFDLVAGDHYDVRTTAPITGALGIAALEHPAFRRTDHPLHSFAVAGVNADRFLEPDDPSSFGPRSAFALLHALNAVLVAWDLSLNDAFTYVHFIEEQEQVPYRAWKKFRISYTDLAGTTTQRSIHRYTKRAGHINELFKAEGLLLNAGALSRAESDGHQLINVDLAKAHIVIVDDIRKNKARSIHRFSWDRWLRDSLKTILRPKSHSRYARTKDQHASGTA